MKFLKKPLIILSALILVLLTLASAIKWKMERPPAKVGKELIKHFSFSDAQDLKEWDDKLLAGNKTRYTLSDVGGVKCVKADSQDSASAMYYKQDLSSIRRPIISWDWKVEKFPVHQKDEELKSKEEFDFGAQFYVIFSAKFFLNAKAIQYVWTEKAPVGTAVDSPYTKNVKILVLESGPSEEWKHEERNIEEDFRNLFGEELEKDVAAVSFMTDSDSTGTTALAYLNDVKLGYLGVDPNRKIRIKEKKRRKWKRSKRFPFRKIDADLPR